MSDLDTGNDRALAPQFHAGDAATSPTVLKPFEFRGEGFEYFKIWIVNILLTILTLGIYSAWAKVRNNRYFYSNFHLDGHSFEYLADPITILKGRLVAFTALVIYVLVSEFFPLVGIGLALLLLMVMPFLIVRSLQFNHRMSAYRNVQFRFHGKSLQAAEVFYFWPLIGVLTLGIMYPYALLRLNRFIVENSAYGTTRFEFTASYKDYGKIFLIMIGILVVMGLVAAGLSTLMPQLGLIVVIGYFGLMVYSVVALTNLYYNSVLLVEHGFEAKLTIGSYTAVILINLFLIAITLGLYLPAAKVRMAKYFASHIEFRATGSLDGFAAAEREQVSALGEEFGDAFDFDIGVT